MKRFYVFLAFISLVKADLSRALNLMSRCQSDTKFLDICVSPQDMPDDAGVEERKRIVHELHSSRFFADKKR